MMFPLNHGVMAAAVAATPPAVDPYWDSVAALLHFDNPDDVDTFTDEAGLDWDSQGSPLISSDQSVFGGRSCFFDGSQEQVYVTKQDSRLDLLGSNFWTVEGFFYLNSLGRDHGIYYNGLPASNNDRIQIQVNSSNIFGVYIQGGTGTGETFYGAATVEANKWYYFSCVRDGSEIRVYLDGEQVSSGNYSATLSGNPSGYIGLTRTSSTPRSMDGYIDEIRVTNGVARYDQDYPVPDAPFPGLQQPEGLVLNFTNDFHSGVVGANQGVAYDGTHFYITGGGGVGGLGGNQNNNILKYDSSLSLVTSRDVTNDNGGAHEQVNGVFYEPISGRLLVGANNYPSTPHQGWVYEYDPSDLSFIQAYDLGERWMEACVLHDGHWFTVNASAHEIVEFDENWTLVQVHTLEGPDLGGFYWQAIFVIDGIFYLNFHEPENQLWAYEYDGSNFSLLTTACTQPTENCTQGAFRHEGAVYWAERLSGGSKIVRTDLPGGAP